MMSFFNWQLLSSFLIPFLTVLLVGLIGFVIENRLQKFRQNLELQPDRFLGKYSFIIKSFRGVILTWSIVGAIALMLPGINIPSTLNILIEKILIVIALTMGTILVSRLAVNLIQLYSLENETAVSLTSLFEYLTKVLIFSIGFLIIIQSIGIKITALITAFGIGSLSIGLAFQNTLSNLISGVNIIVSRKIRPGDYIQLKDGEEGYVQDVELKYTLIKDIYNNIIVIPNAKIIDASFKNYTLDSSSILITIKIGVSYDSNLEKVEKVTLEVAKSILENTEGGDKEFEPFLRYENFDYFAINLTVYLKINEYFDKFIITHEFMKAIHHKYQEENITMAYPLKYYGASGEIMNNNSQ
ncbi:mechanosensitive ion channel family protein [Cyanobacterium aponinum FACHB-4101]|uniref:mechanosensitive ion channel family protein n=1 Tax=Cyanobacterium aponinum TaxID=379064 RepID=UPI0016804FAC|nr:mechanosensitive ion channel family protein [Cyanobacterium aponinum]MBD2392697.1 mechanosensitive ion channel family protein [Cyanobacterium aponinum FACHB-4101]